MNQEQLVARRYPVGAEIVEGGVHFRVWAASRQRVSVVVDGTRHTLEREDDGYFSARIAGAGAGARYGFVLDDGEKALPDPASRSQPDGPHGLSAVVDDRKYAWNDGGWRGLSGSQILYEMHIGTFTAEGTWESAARELPYLAELGITAVEIMPVAEFPGRFGWGYDGVDVWAPTRLYGSPDDMRRFVDAAHGAGLGVLLDVVYNHVGPSGNYLREFSTDYFTDRYANEWGEPINFDGPRSEPVRDFFASNAAYWIAEFHLDGLRIDATQSMFDGGREHILALITGRARAAAGARSIVIIGENEPQDVRLVRDYGLDALWNDDFHHSARVALTGRTDAYYTDYRGRPQEFVSMARHGFLYQGQWYAWQQQHRGTPAIGCPRRIHVWYLQNHDQVANSGSGARLHEIAARPAVRAMTALLLLGPAQPMLFQGQEFAASSPFLYFADHEPELARQVADGRREFLAQFPPLATPDAQAHLAAPHDPRTFARCKLDHSEREKNAHVLQLHRDLIALRRNEPVFRDGSDYGVEGAVLSDRAFLLRYARDDGDDRLIVINLGEALDFAPVTEPLLAPPAGKHWELLWSSESPQYGGDGVVPVEQKHGWRFQAMSAVVLAAVDGERRVRKTNAKKEQSP